MGDWNPQRKVSRRGLLVGGLALGTAGIGAAVYGTSTGSSGAGNSAPGGASLKMAYTSGTSGQSLDPQAANRLSVICPAVYGYLSVLDSNYSAQPQDLATDWSTNKTADRWTFRLRDGVRFHDGRKLTSRDVAYTLRRALDPGLKSPAAGTISGLIDPNRISTPDPTTVIFDLAQPHSDLPILLLNYRLGIIPEDSGNTIGNQGIGTGPFRVESFEPDVRTELRGNQDYHAGPPQLDRLSVITIKDSQARTNALLAGQVDFISPELSLDSGAAQAVKANPACRVLQLPSGYWDVLVMKTDQPPFNDPRVRLAFKLVVDCNDMVQRVLNGAGEAANHNPVWTKIPYYRDLGWRRDIDRAKALLAEAGYPDGLRVQLDTAPVTGTLVPLSVAFAQTAEEAGIHVDVRQHPADTYYADAYKKGNFVVNYWGTRVADQVLNEFFRSDAPANETGWKSPGMDALLSQARKATDEGVRSDLYGQCQQLLQQESGHIIPYFQNAQRGLRKNVTNFPGHGGGGIPEPTTWPTFQTLAAT